MDKRLLELPAIALGTWSWGAGMAGGDQVFGNHTDTENLKPVFEAAYNAGLTMWNTAATGVDTKGSCENPMV